jgi:hypothetical protein
MLRLCFSTSQWPSNSRMLISLTSPSPELGQQESGALAKQEISCACISLGFPVFAWNSPYSNLLTFQQLEDVRETQERKLWPTGKSPNQIIQRRAFRGDRTDLSEQISSCASKQRVQDVLPDRGGSLQGQVQLWSWDRRSKPFPSPIQGAEAMASPSLFGTEDRLVSWLQIKYRAKSENYVFSAPRWRNENSGFKLRTYLKT